MKKKISIALASLMLFSAVVFAIPASAEIAQADRIKNINYVQAKYFTGAPTIDGVISEAEWGEKSFTVSTIDDANDIYCPKGSNSKKNNTYFYWRDDKKDPIQKPEFAVNRIAYDVWLRWDENKYYIGVKVKDFNGHSLKNGKNDTWNGDSLLFRLDPAGPNSATGNEIYDELLGTPWEAPGVIADFVCGYVEIAGNFFEAYDNTNNKGLTAYSKPALGAVDIAVAPAGTNYSADTVNNITTYEIAVPWVYIFVNQANKLGYTPNSYDPAIPVVLSKTDFDKTNNPYGAYGMQLGMSMAVFGAERDASKYETFLSWGSGISKTQVESDPKSCAGSNSVELVEDSVTPANYEKKDPSVLVDNKPTIYPKQYYYDYLNGDIDEYVPISYVGSLKSLTYDNPSDLGYWGGTYQGTITTDSDASHGNCLTFDRDENGNLLEQSYIDTRDEDMIYRYPLSYTFEFDIKYTGTEVTQSGYNSYIANWFGGSSGYAYTCGYFMADNMFKIIDNSTNEVVASSTALQLQKDQWYNWRFQYDNNTCTVRLIVNDQLIFNIFDRYFYYSNADHLKDGTLLMFRMVNTQVKFDNVKIYNFKYEVPFHNFKNVAELISKMRAIPTPDKMTIDDYNTAVDTYTKLTKLNPEELMYFRSESSLDEAYELSDKIQIYTEFHSGEYAIPKPGDVPEFDKMIEEIEKLPAYASMTKEQKIAMLSFLKYIGNRIEDNITDEQYCLVVYFAYYHFPTYAKICNDYQAYIASGEKIKLPGDEPEPPETTTPETTVAPETTVTPKTTGTDTTAASDYKSSPQTGDNMLIIAIVAVAALAICATVIIVRKRNNKSDK